MELERESWVAVEREVGDRKWREKIEQESRKRRLSEKSGARK